MFRKYRFFFNLISIVIFLTVFTVSLFAPTGSAAADPKKKLTEIQKQLKTTKKKVKESKKKEKSVLAKIQDINRSIKKKQKELKEYDKRISETQSKITRLSQEISILNTKLDNKKDHLNERLTALYKQQYGGHALVLISAKDYQDLFKKSRYLSLIAHYDSQVIDKYSTDLKKFNAKKSELEALNKKLKTDQKLARDTQKALRTDRAKKDKLLAMIRSKRKSYEKKVKELEVSSKKLLDMMKKLKIKKLPKSITGKGFRASKGKLPWPVNGKIVIPYGPYKDPAYNITMFKNGIELKPKSGNKPKAVAGGRVVYADWFKGYGLLLIIDHGSGYHSLYGNLSEIFLETGDILIGGAALGKIGNSSLLDYPTLYFEIRHKGKPIDPMQWLQRKHTRVGKNIN